MVSTQCVQVFRGVLVVRKFGPRNQIVFLSIGLVSRSDMHTNQQFSRSRKTYLFFDPRVIGRIDIFEVNRSHTMQ